MTKKSRIEDLLNTPQTQLTPDEIENRIRVRAYEIYLDRGSREGTDLEDWLQAEREVRQQIFEGSTDAAVSISTAIA